IWLLKDFHPYLSDPRVVRGLRDLASEAKPSIRAIVIVAPDLVVPRELEKDVAIVQVPLPGEAELSQALQDALAAATSDARVAVQTAGVAAVAAAARGLTLREARRAFRRAL